jgi:hypothetical protein
VRASCTNSQTDCPWSLAINRAASIKPVATQTSRAGSVAPEAYDDVFGAERPQ